MTTDNTNVFPDRSHPAHLPVMDTGNRGNIIFVTVCTEMRKEILATQECVDTIKKAWMDANTWRIGRYVIMPNHVHFFCSPALRECPALEKWASYWKSLSARNWPHPEGGKVWQRDCWDRQLRSGESYAEKWEYVRHNPVRAGLVNRPEDWPWQGELNVLEWHDA